MSTEDKSNVPAAAPPTYTAAVAYPPGAQPSAPSYGTAQPAPQNVTYVYPTFPGFGGSFEHQRVQRDTVKYLRLVPCFHICPAILFFCLNTIIPGIGTMLSCLFLCCANTVVQGESMGKIACITFWLGMLQLITCPIVLGYLLAIFWSYGTIFNYRLYYKRPLDPSEIQGLTAATPPSA